MPDRDTLGEDVIRRMRVEYELGAAGPKVPRQRQVPPALFISDDELRDNTSRADNEGGDMELLLTWNRGDGTVQSGTVHDASEATLAAIREAVAVKSGDETIGALMMTLTGGTERAPRIFYCRDLLGVEVIS